MNPKLINVSRFIIKPADAFSKVFTSYFSGTSIQNVVRVTIHLKRRINWNFSYSSFHLFKVCIIPRFQILFDNVGNDSFIWNMRWFGSIESSSVDHAL
jgi:hypothetical protein